MFGVEFARAIENCFTQPLLLKIGIPTQFAPIVWCLPPIIGVIFGPLIGSYSDVCSLKWGRRRPFILMYTVGVTLGLIVLANISLIEAIDNTRPYPNADVWNNVSHVVTESLGDEDISSNKSIIKIVVSILTICVMDFCIDSCFSPSYSYMIDITKKEQHGKAITIGNTMTGLGGFCGFLIGAINWEQNSIGPFKDQFQLVYIIAAFVFFISSMISISSFKEIPLSELPFMNISSRRSSFIVTSSYVMAEYQDVFEKESQSLRQRSRSTISSKVEKDTIQIPQERRFGSHPNIPLNEEAYIPKKEKDMPKIMMEKREKENKNAKANDSASVTVVVTPPSLDGDNEVASFSFKEYFKSWLSVPSFLWIIMATHLFTYMSVLAYAIYFSDVISQVIFKGDPSASEKSYKLIQYEHGIRFSSLTMSAYSLTTTIYSFLTKFVVQKIGIKIPYQSSMVIQAIGTLLFFFFSEYWSAWVVAFTSGLLYSSLLSFPIMIVAEYHSKNEEDKDSERGLGKDISLITSQVFLAQLLLSAFIGSIQDNFGQLSTAIVSCILVLIGFIFSFFIKYPKISKKEKQKF